MHAAGEIDLDENMQTYLKEFVLPQGTQTAENPVTFRNIFHSFSQALDIVTFGIWTIRGVFVFPVAVWIGAALLS